MLLALSHIDNDGVASAGVTGAEPGLLAGVVRLDSLDSGNLKSFPRIMIEKLRNLST